MTKAMKIMLIAPLAVIGIVLFTAIGGYAVMYLWNWLAPALFGWPQLTFWKALGLLALCRILFGGVSGRGFARTGVRERMGERWSRMSPEERERWRQTCAGRWAASVPPSDKPQA